MPHILRVIIKSFPPPIFEMTEVDDRCQEQQETLKERALQLQQLEQVVARQKNEINRKTMEITQLQQVGCLSGDLFLLCPMFSLGLS